jgi:1-pyrroline-5-carboxylate dehydrogenase
MGGSPVREPFRNEPLTDFRAPANREAFAAALEEARRQVGRQYPLVIGGERVWTGRWIESENPCRKGEVVGRVAAADQEAAERAIAVAEDAYAEWSRTDPAARARVLWRAAAIMRRRRHFLSALMVLEVGKTWSEADADTAEAIDFLEFYGREMVRLGGPQPLTPVPGEDNELYYLPLGVGAVIPPWNFPLAITTGMTSAAVVAGNAVVLKPASLSPVVAAHLVQILEEAGLPPGVVNFVPGPGGEVGDFLTQHPRIRFVSFTGSRDVGVRIYERAARVVPGQAFLRRVVAEMGGKDCIVVDSSADLDEAAAAIVTSAFGFQGQKCSACSRVVAVRDVYDGVLERVVERVRSLRLGPAEDPASDLAAVCGPGQFEKVLGYIQLGTREGRLAAGGGAGDPAGYYVHPTVFADVDPSARIAQEEIFGPVVAFTRASDFRQAIDLANATEYGLTGSVFARDRARLEYARREFHVGNLYFNRKCTGALVGGHPFGGFGMSGTDSKAGGRDYLLLFTQAKAVSERL